MQQKQTLSQHCIGLQTGFNYTMYGIPVYRILQEVGYYEVETYFIRTLHWPTNGAQVTLEAE